MTLLIIVLALLRITSPVVVHGEPNMCVTLYRRMDRACYVNSTSCEEDLSTYNTFCGLRSIR